MHKVRLSKINYQLVAENSGQSPEVLMANYNEALESEKRTLAFMVETSFYQQELLRIQQSLKQRRRIFASNPKQS